MIPNCKKDTKASDSIKAFCWDGKSSSVNASNLSLWQQIVDYACENGFTLVYIKSSDYSNPVTFHIHDITVGSNQKKFYGNVINLGSKNSEASGSSVTATSHVVTIKYTVSGSKITVTEVSGASISSVTGSPTDLYLPTNLKSVKSFTPTYDYHPATKKYVDDNTPTNIKNGTESGSVRTVNSANESDSYSLGVYSFAEGYNTQASGQCSHAEGYVTKATNTRAHSEGDYTTASGMYSHAEGTNTESRGTASHTEGGNTNTTGMYSHAEGHFTNANGDSSHAEGTSTQASGNYAHSENNDTLAAGVGSHAEGYGTSAQSDYQHVQGKYNVVDLSNRYAHILGNGTKSDSSSTRHNAHTIDWDGNAWFQGDIMVGGDCYGDSNSKTVATTDMIPTATTIVNNLTSTSTTSALSANQGKALNDIITEVRNTTISGMTALSELLVSPTNIKIGSVTTTGSYGFTQIGNVFTPNNLGKDSSTAQTDIMFKSSISANKLKIVYKIKTESSYDKLSVLVDGTEVISGVSGEKSGSYIVTSSVSTSTKITLKYVKDSSSSEPSESVLIALIDADNDLPTFGTSSSTTEDKGIAEIRTKAIGSVASSEEIIDLTGVSNLRGSLFSYDSTNKGFKISKSGIYELHYALRIMVNSLSSSDKTKAHRISIFKASSSSAYYSTQFSIPAHVDTATAETTINDNVLISASAGDIIYIKIIGMAGAYIYQDLKRSYIKEL